MTKKTKSVLRLIRYPKNNNWTELLRFVVQSMPHDHHNLKFCVNLLSYAYENNGLTKKQVACIAEFVDEYIAEIDEKMEEI